jgi:membrane peptidoglycan carboxypeptidase
MDIQEIKKGPIEEFHFTQSGLTRRAFLQWLGSGLFVASGMHGFLTQKALAARAQSVLPMAGCSVFWRTVGQKQLNQALASGWSAHRSALPGSVFKLVTVSTILESRAWPVERQVECRGSARINGVPVHCQFPHGSVNLMEALAQSCNIAVATAAMAVSPARLVEMARAFGYRVENRAEHASRVHLVLGLSPTIRVSADGMLAMTEAIATGTLEQAGHLSSATGLFLRQAMHLAVRTGTAKHLDPKDRFRIAAKTGTVPAGNGFYSWVTGYFPREKPTIVFCVHAANGTSQDKAIPAARRFLQGQSWDL